MNSRTVGSRTVDSRTVDNQTVDSRVVEKWNEEEAEWPALPTETEIYILPDGRVMIADLPVELTQLVTELGRPLDDE